MSRPATTQEPMARAYDWESTSPCFAVIDAIARYEQTETTRMADELAPPLQERINLDALDTLLGNNDVRSISFSYADYEVHLNGETVVISSPESEPR